MGPNQDLDIVRNIALIEKLKCGMLSGTADLFSSMANVAADASEKREILAELLITNYLLAERLGISFEELEDEAAGKIKASIAKSTSAAAAQKALLRHLMP